MDFNTILLLTLAGLLLVMLLVLAGVVLSARAYTTLVELIHGLFSQVITQQGQNQSVQTHSSQNQVSDTTASPSGDMPTGSGK